MSGWKFPKRKVIEGSWILLQCLALVAILFAPLWIRPNSRSIAERFSLNSHVGSSVIVDRRPTSITSRVVPFPGPTFRKNLKHSEGWSEDLESETRQIRFEWTLNPEPTEEWRLATIERQNPKGGWDNVTLVTNEFGIPIGSVYLELGEGVNTFAAQLVSSKTKKEKKVLLHVAQKR